MGQDQLAVSRSPDVHFDSIAERRNRNEPGQSVVRVTGGPPPVPDDFDSVAQGIFFPETRLQEWIAPLNSLPNPLAPAPFWWEYL
jgi:hypothetical protein